MGILGNLPLHICQNVHCKDDCLSFGDARACKYEVVFPFSPYNLLVMSCKSKNLLLYNNNCNIEFSRLLFILSSQRLSVNSKEVNLILFLNQNICEIIGNPRLVSFLKKISYQSIHVSD